MGLCLCPASLMRTFYCSTFNRSMLLISREKFTELCACSKCLFPSSPHWLTCMQNPMQIGPRLAVNFRHCPLEKASTASAATYTPALALDYIGGTKPLSSLCVWDLVLQLKMELHYTKTWQRHTREENCRPAFLKNIETKLKILAN